MTYLIYDNTFPGLLTAIFEVYERKLHEVCIRRDTDVVPPMFADRIVVTTDQVKYERVAKKLTAVLGKKGLQDLWKAWLSETEEIGEIILGVVRYALREGRNILNDYGDFYVLRLQETLKKTGREKHRMEAFVRFQLTGDGLYYAVVSPDFNVLPLIAKHFTDRYADQRWIIYDSQRKYGIYYDLQSTSFVSMEQGEHMEHNLPKEEILNGNEKIYQVLWKDYFDSTNIKSRKNMKLHLQHVPRRYWKYLTEKSKT